MVPAQKLSKELPFLKEIQSLKKEVDNHKPFKKDLQEKVFQKLRLDWNYNTNAIEGNSYTRGETITLLVEGLTANNKPSRDGKEIEWHNKAIDVMMSLIKQERVLNEADIRSLHQLILGEEYYSPAKTREGKTTRKLIEPGKYKTSPNHVETQTGEIHYYASVEETPLKMRELVDWYNETLALPDISSIVLAALFHHKFVSIHPFDDGNGRMTRLLTNFILLKSGYPISVIKQEKRRDYYAALSRADNGELIPFIELIAETVKDSLKIYLKAIAGEDINEPDDLDKEIDLLLKKFSSEDVVEITKNNDSIKRIFDGFLVKFANDLTYKISQIDSLFNDNEKLLSTSNGKLDLKKGLVLAKSKHADFGHIFYFISTKDKYKYNEFTQDDIFGDIGIPINNIESIDLNYDWFEFLKNDQQNNLKLKICLFFEKFKYKIVIKGDTILEKYYHEIPSKKEIDNLTASIIKKNIIEIIKSWD